MGIVNGRKLLCHKVRQQSRLTRRAFFQRLVHAIRTPQVESGSVVYGMLILDAHADRLDVPAAIRWTVGLGATDDQDWAERGLWVRVLVVSHVSLDGVLQGPDRPDEDTRGGFRHGGWARREDDPAMRTSVRVRMGAGFVWLLGRRTFENSFGPPAQVYGSFMDTFTQRTTYVASSHPGTGLAWPNTTLLSGEVPAAVAALRRQPGGNLVIIGSGQLVRSLLPHHLIDEVLLIIHPLVLGSGRRLFGPNDQAHPMRLVDATPTAAGALLATYQPSSDREES